MKFLRQLGIILIIVFLGEFIRKIFNLPLPGNVLGMIILLCLLSLKIIKVETIDDISNFMLEHLPFFFIPGGVSLISNLELLKSKGLIILLICLISTAIVMIVTGLTIQLLKRSFKI
ncbi:CidA/LrgA family protein [Paramaledivibacter caminithermalis]|uniref:Holin-like protein n=1 Tax=Paramaledivibacter caminithermalis (strain DSM 15212 / CIP 107654 / DViRD3) TaxID=1121301 RepID=A0A1M6SIH6_PARC5|nr:CidA/LrgA family protein [Paramaledivibacter caminithermalis]SHK44523.1 holin-like protein [Paramaledivibacter caminithermalis DSM 15212]